MIVYKDVLQKLSSAGWSAYRLVKERKMGNATIQRIRNGESVSTDTIDTICELCQCQPGDIMSHIATKERAE